MGREKEGWGEEEGEVGQVVVGGGGGGGGGGVRGKEEKKGVFLFFFFSTHFSNVTFVYPFFLFSFFFPTHWFIFTIENIEIRSGRNLEVLSI